MPRRKPKDRARELERRWRKGKAVFPPVLAGRAPVANALASLYTRFVRQHIPPGSRVLEIGAGKDGFLLQCVPKDRRKNWVQMDVHDSLKDSPGKKKVIGSFFALPFKDGKFDFVVGSACLDMADEQTLPLAAGEIHRVLKRGGTMYHLMDASPSASLWRDRKMEEGDIIPSTHEQHIKAIEDGKEVSDRFQEALKRSLEGAGLEVEDGIIRAVGVVTDTAMHDKYDRAVKARPRPGVRHYHSRDGTLRLGTLDPAKLKRALGRDIPPGAVIEEVNPRVVKAVKR